MRKRYGPTEKELEFIDKFTDHGDWELAAKESGYSEKSAYVIGCQLKKKLAHEIDARLTEKMGGDCVLARSVIVKLAKEGMSEDVRLKAAKDIMDRGGHPASKEIISKKDQTPVHDKIQKLKEALAEQGMPTDIADQFQPEGTEDAIRH